MISFDLLQSQQKTTTGPFDRMDQYDMVRLIPHLLRSSLKYLILIGQPQHSGVCYSPTAGNVVADQERPAHLRLLVLSHLSNHSHSFHKHNCHHLAPQLSIVFTVKQNRRTSVLIVGLRAKCSSCCQNYCFVHRNGFKIINR